MGETIVRARQVAILGNTNVDLILAPLPRLPEWGHEMLVPLMQVRAAGAAGYAAMALARLGVAASVIGAVGDDLWAYFIRRALGAHASLDLSALETLSAPTGVCVGLVGKGGQRGFVSHAGAAGLADAALLARHIERLLSCRFVLVCGYFFMPALRGAPLQAFMRQARAAGSMVLLDTGWDPEDWPQATVEEVLALLPNVDLFLPNLDEAQALTAESEPLDCARALMNRGARAVALKLGSAGSLWLDRSGPALQPPRAVEALDTTGAGDAFNAALIYGFLQGWSPQRALAFANALCSLVVSRLEERFPSAAEVFGLLGWPA